MDIYAGTTFCRAGSKRTWVTDEKLGSGCFGSVFTVRSGTQVGALKLLGQTSRMTGKKLERAIETARVQSHDEIYRYKQVSGIGGFPKLLDPQPADVGLFYRDPVTGWLEPGFFVMERAGPSLASVTAAAPLAPIDVARVGTSLLTTLQQLHQKVQLSKGHTRPPLAYMDLKPANICWGIDESGAVDTSKVFLIDLGTLRELGTMAVSPGVITQGNLAYSGFNYIAKLGGYCRADDVEALGLVLLSLLGVVLPWKEGDAATTLVEAMRIFPGNIKLDAAGLLVSQFVKEARAQAGAGRMPDYQLFFGMLGSLAKLPHPLEV